MSASLGALRRDDFGAGIAGALCAIEILNLADEFYARPLDLLSEWPLIAEGKHEDGGLSCERLVEEFGIERHAPGDVADADPDIAGGTELLVHPVFAAVAGLRISIAAADDSKPARLRHRRCKLAAGNAAHRCEEDRMGDAEEARER